jgi:hypothetical protein
VNDKIIDHLPTSAIYSEICLTLISFGIYLKFGLYRILVFIRGRFTEVLLYFNSNIGSTLMCVNTKTVCMCIYIMCIPAITVSTETRDYQNVIAGSTLKQDL